MSTPSKKRRAARAWMKRERDDRLGEIVTFLYREREMEKRIEQLTSVVRANTGRNHIWPVSAENVPDVMRVRAPLGDPSEGERIGSILFSKNDRVGEWVLRAICMALPLPGTQTSVRWLAWEIVPR